MITDYASLQTDIADWLNREDLTAVIPTFIQLCDAQLKRRIKTKFKTTLSLPILAANGGAETISGTSPDQILSLYITSPEEYAGKINPVTPDQLWDSRRVERHASARPKVASIVDLQVLFSPVPDQDYDAELVIEGPLVALSDVDTTNYVILNAPDVYLYGSLAQSAPYLREDPRVELWSGKFEMSLKELEAQRDLNEWPNTPIQAVPSPIGVLTVDDQR